MVASLLIRTMFHNDECAACTAVFLYSRNGYKRMFSPSNRRFYFLISPFVKYEWDSFSSIAGELRFIWQHRKRFPAFRFKKFHIFHEQDNWLGVDVFESIVKNFDVHRNDILIRFLVQQFSAVFPDDFLMKRTECKARVRVFDQTNTYKHLGV